MIVTTQQNISSSELKELATDLSEIDDRFHSLNFFGQQIFFFPEKTNSQEHQRNIAKLAGVAKVYSPPIAHQLCSKEWTDKRTSFSIKGEMVGDGNFQLIAGPCAVESEEQIFSIAAKLNELGIKFIRGGAYKPRTSPYSFQGLETEGLKLLRKAADKYDLRVVTEVIDRSVLDDVIMYADVIQIGARNMQNFFLLKELGRIDTPVFLKRGMSAKISEWLAAAEYIISHGNPKIILCERGIRTFDDSLRNTLDVAAIPLIKELSHLPIYTDPSHGTGSAKFVKPMALAAMAAGTDGIMVETHPNPEEALSDGPQSLNYKSLTELNHSLQNLKTAM